ncbi:MAG: DUF1385 domain-containing protein [Candidatus Wallbacteria bacterium]|nr:DUF1385 domain-containing protein [Candidatus Wallbacteria bacterium]
MEKIRRLGGQAVIEGIMLRDRDSYSIAVREQGNEVFTLYEKFEQGWFSRHKLDHIPFLRGIYLLCQSLWLGVKSLGMSAVIQSGSKEMKVNNAELGFSLIAAIVMGLTIFILIPFGVADCAEKYVFSLSPFYFNLIEGIVRLLMFVSYLCLITKIPDVGRLLAYHGAEHKVINAYESGMELNLANVRGCKRTHPRCGTSFILFFIVVTTVVFSLIPTSGIWQRILMRIFFLPILGAASYELLQIFNRLFDPGNWILNLGTLFQRLTTREPDDRQMEVAIIALKGLLEREN